MRIAFTAVPVPPAPLSVIQQDYYFYLFASRIEGVLGHLDEADFLRFKYLEPVHLGLLALIAFLEKEGHECSFFGPLGINDETDCREEQLLKKILSRASEFDLIGFSPITASYPAARRMAAAVREENPDVWLAIGGPHAWARDQEILMNSDFDVVVRKEGEATTSELLTVLEEGGSLDKVAGISYREGNRIIRNPDRPRLDRWDLPLPAYEHLEDNFAPGELFPEKKIMIPIARVTPATGCLNDCIWCADFWKKDITWQNTSRFQEEVQLLREERGSRYFYLGTHDFFHDIPAALEVARVLGEMDGEIAWEAQTRVNPGVTRENLRELAKQGCRCLHLGVESGSQELLNTMGKNIKLEEARKLCLMAREEGIHTHTYWIIGVPEESRDTARATIATMKQWLQAGISSSAEINLLVGYPGTPFYENPSQYGVTWQSPNYSTYDGRSIPTFATSKLTTRDLEYLFQLALDEYCSVMSLRMGSREEVLKRLDRRFPSFNPAVMEAAF